MRMNTAFDAHDSCTCIYIGLLSTPHICVGKRCGWLLLFIHQTHKCSARPSLYSIRT